MRRALALIFVAAVAAVSAGAGGGGAAGPSYWLILDNAFGLTEGSDVKVAGVRAGVISAIELDEDQMRARVGIDLTQDGYDELRRDVRCETRPQSLIGEYFVSCQPGRGARLPKGSTVGVERTATTIPVDLINNIMRRPYRERFTIIFNELGGALAARGGDLNETIRRASPALRETDRVLAILRRQRKVIGRLTTDADRILSSLAGNRADLNRFVRETAETTEIAALRTQPLGEGFRKLPRFFAQLRPTLDALGDAAERQEGAITALSENRDTLKTFLDRLGPLSERSRPAMRTLGEAAVPGRAAAEAAPPRLRELRRAVDPLPELANNLAIVLEHLDDPRWAVEPDKRMPGGRGLTGLEALLRYVYANAQAANLADANNYMGKINLLVDRACGSYADAAKVRDDRENDRCRGWLGPNQPGVTTPDPTAARPARRRRTARHRRPVERREPAPAAAGPEREQRPAPAKQSPVGDLGGIVDDLLSKPGQILEDLPTEPGPLELGPILDYLLGA